LTFEKFQHIYDMRLLLEPYTAATASTKLTDTTRDNLSLLADKMEASTLLDSAQAYGQFAILDAKFHALIAKESGNTLIEDALNRAYAHTHLFRLSAYSGVTKSGAIEHAQIVKAIVAADSKGAREAMEHHIIQSRERWRPYFD
jgi:DNA-binding GntR family transcriptional regulator